MEIYLRFKQPYIMNGKKEKDNNMELHKERFLTNHKGFFLRLLEVSTKKVGLLGWSKLNAALNVHTKCR